MVRLIGTYGPDTLLGGNTDDQIFGMGGSDLLRGGAGTDTLGGGWGADTLFGGGSNDLLKGGAGADTLDGGWGADTLFGGAGKDLLKGGAGADTLGGGWGADTLFGGGSNDLLKGGAGADTLDGGWGADALFGGAGNDLQKGGAGADTLGGGWGADTLFGGGSNDLLKGGAGADTLGGGSGADTLSGGAGLDRLNGGAGDDRLFGRSGNDILTGGLGNDTIDGGSGTDTAIYSGRSDQYVINATVSSGSLVVHIHSKNNPNAVDKLVNVELLSFDDATGSVWDFIVPTEVPLALASPLHQLRVFSDTGPSIISIRNDYIGKFSSETFNEYMCLVDGVAPKNLDEELTTSVWNLSHVQSFAAENPNALILNDFNARETILSNRISDDLGPEHFLYEPGIGTQTPVERSQTQISLSTTSPFSAPNADGTAIGNDVVLLVPYKANGNLNWRKAEWAAIAQMSDSDVELLRGLFGTTSHDAPHGLYVAPLVNLSLPWNAGEGYQGDRTVGFYNFSTMSPTDEFGRRAFDILAESLASMFEAGGAFERFHGLVLDVLMDRPVIGTVDANVDGTADNAIDDADVNTFELGALRFLQSLRAGLGDDRILNIDQGYNAFVGTYRYVNGYENEGLTHPFDGDASKWSIAINLQNFFVENVEYEFVYNQNFLKLNDIERGTPEYDQMLGFGLATLSILGVPSQAIFISNPDRQVRLHDWQQNGVEENPDWLGSHVGETSYLTDGVTYDNFNFASPRMYGAEFIETRGDLFVEANDPDAPTLRWTVTLNDFSGGSLTLYMDLFAEALRDIPDLARDINVSITGWRSQDSLWALTGGSGEQRLQFSFENVPPGDVTFYFEMRGAEGVTISNVSATEGIATMYREFDDGVIFVNPDTVEVTINLSEIFPDIRFREVLGYDGSEDRDGSLLGDDFVLSRKTSIFLIKIDGDVVLGSEDEDVIYTTNKRGNVLEAGGKSDTIYAKPGDHVIGGDDLDGNDWDELIIDTTLSHEVTYLSDKSGVIRFGDGSVLTFVGIEDVII